MSILVPVVSTGITLNEVPDKVAFFIELGECSMHCKGCHSPHLWEKVENKMTLETLVHKADNAVEQGADAIVLMGGTSNGLDINTLLDIIENLSYIAPVCLYSGSDDEELNRYIFFHSELKWMKTGSYQETLGGLTSKTTNQKFYEKGDGYAWQVDSLGVLNRLWHKKQCHDITYKFQHGTNDE